MVKVEDADLLGPGLEMNVLKEKTKDTKLLDEVKFVPYYFRSNRGGRGEMRVGLRRWIR